MPPADPPRSTPFEPVTESFNVAAARRELGHVADAPWIPCRATTRTWPRWSMEESAYEPLEPPSGGRGFFCRSLHEPIVAMEVLSGDVAIATTPSLDLDL